MGFRAYMPPLDIVDGDQTIIPRLAIDGGRINQSIGAGATVTGGWNDQANRAETARVCILSSGADITVTLQGGTDEGLVYDITSYAAGATGGQTSIDCGADNSLRLSITNSGTGSQSVDAFIAIGG